MKEYLKNASKEMKNIHSLIGASLLGALNPILGMLTIHINQFLQIGFSSLTHAVTGYLYGPVLARFYNKRNAGRPYFRFCIIQKARNAKKSYNYKSDNNIFDKSHFNPIVAFNNVRQSL